jgi:hypothetical protein
MVIATVLFAAGGCLEFAPKASAQALADTFHHKAACVVMLQGSNRRSTLRQRLILKRCMNHGACRSHPQGGLAVGVSLYCEMCINQNFEVSCVANLPHSLLHYY